jgi:UDP-2,3-diacylglucosamine hydrolase
MKKEIEFLKEERDLFEKENIYLNKRNVKLNSDLKMVNSFKYIRQINKTCFEKKENVENALLNWMGDYFEKELDIPVYHDTKIFEFNNKQFFIGHGDGLGPGDKGYKRMKKVFVHPFSKWLYRWLHPDIGMKLAQYLSVKNKLISGDEDVIFLGEEKEWLVQYSKRKLESQHFDYFIFGHRHLPMEVKVGDNSYYYNLGDWIHYYTYGVFDGESFKIVEDK